MLILYWRTVKQRNTIKATASAAAVFGVEGVAISLQLTGIGTQIPGIRGAPARSQRRTRHP